MRWRAAARQSLALPSRCDCGFLQSFLEVGGREGFDHLIQVAFHEAIEIVKGEADAVVGDAVLGVIVGANFFFAASSVFLFQVMVVFFFFFFASFVLEAEVPYFFERFLFVLLVAAPVLEKNDGSRRNVI